MSQLPYEPFPSTRWSLVSRVSHPDIKVQREALGELLHVYLPAIRSYLFHVRRIPADRVEDLLQGFLLSKVLEDEFLTRADRNRGLFRTFLLATLDHYLISEHRAATALKRQPATAAEVLDPASELPAPDPQPDEAYEIAWAREVVAQAVQRMEGECARLNRSDVWGVFEHRILAAVTGDRHVLPYEELVGRYTLQSPAHAANILITAKRMFARMLRAVVAEYEADENAIDQEIAELRAILSRQR